MSQDAAKKLAVCGLLLLAVLAVFGQTLRHDFVDFDDNLYVYKNSHLQTGLSGEGLCWALTTTHNSMWAPLTWLSYLLDFQLHGLEPWGYHLTNVLLHAATTVVLFLVLRAMTGDHWPSTLAAAIFALHPLRVESVAWVAERKGLLSGLCFASSLGAYLRYARRPFSLLRYLPVVGLFALGLMAKPDLVTLPFVLVLLDYWPLGRVGGRGTRAAGRAGHLRSGSGSGRGTCAAGRGAPSRHMGRLVGEKVPLLLLTALSCIMAPRTQGKAVVGLEMLPIAPRLANASLSCVAYLGKFVWPTNLAALYPLRGAGLQTWKVAAAVLLLTAITAAALACWRRYPHVLVGWLWYLGMLVPMSGLMQLGSHAMADRYTYLPQIGLGIAVAWTAAHVSRSWSRRGWAGGAAAALAVLMACAWQQTGYWRDSETLWTHALACTSRNAIAHDNLGSALDDRGQFDAAIDEYRKALEITPNYMEAHYNLGVVLAVCGRDTEAVRHFRTALALATARNDSALANASRAQIHRLQPVAPVGKRP